MSTIEQRSRVARLLAKVAKGEVKPEDSLEMIKSWKDIPWKEKDLTNAWEGLFHYFADQDIFLRDDNYAESSRDALLAIAQRLSRVAE
jgi:hypothetical protein